LSYEGAEFQLSMIQMEPVFQVQYARAAAVWQLMDLIAFKEEVFAKTRRNGIGSIFWADHQRFFKSMLMAAKVQALAHEAREAIKAGFSVVIGLQSTGEASLESEKQNNGVFPRP
jgi:hypothetical protein